MIRFRFLFPFVLALLSTNLSAQNMDIDLLKSINHSYTPNGGVAFKVVTESVNPISIGLPIGLFIGGKATKNSEMVWNSFEIASASIANGVFTTALKLSVARERPFVTYPNEITKYSKAGSHSFPSGHTSMAFSTATSISILYPKWYIIIPAYSWACSVGYSRMYLGVHYPSDVLAGAFLGSATSIGTHYLFKYIKNKRTKEIGLML